MGTELPSREGAFYFPVGKKLSSGKGASKWERILLGGRNCEGPSSLRVSLVAMVGKGFPRGSLVGRELPSVKRTSQW